MLELVARLPQMQRLVISEVFLRGKSQREVAATLGVTSQSVYCSKKAALDTLRRAFGLRRKDCADGTALCFYAACFGDV